MKGKSGKLVILDTNAWIFHYGLGPQTVVNTVRAIIASLKNSGCTPSYTSITLYEIKKSPRPEIASLRKELLSYLRSVGVEFKEDYWRLLENARKLERILGIKSGKYRNDLAIIVAALISGSIILSCDREAMQIVLTGILNRSFSSALQNLLGIRAAELRVIYVDPTLE